MRNTLLCILTLFTILAHKPVQGQFAKIYSQTYANPLLINPASAGCEDAFSFGLMSRIQWVGFPGAPSIQSFNAHTPLKNTKIGLGFLLNRESYGVNNFYSISANYAYRLLLPVGNISFGIKGGINIGSANEVNLLSDPNDDAFYNDLNRYILPDFGMGIYFYNKKMYAGLSIPQVFSYKISVDKYQLTHNVSYYNIFTTAGYYAKITPDLELKPSVLIRYSLTNEFKGDLYLTAEYKNMAESGIGFRSKESVILLFAYKINQQFKVGYSFDINIGNTGGYTKGSHEIYLKYKLGYKVNVSSPRIL
jgi:type IX secretion system PorP/SprF family membrane protein